ncbi:non-ribosomal peptide synthetase [Hymenobacter sp. CRA2]|uniref:non-ribosomal peptide synthetase n=1 Tax=Hymenobacter sp. CRA2 TaxID=1955620 RepID=UPI0009D59746|nr:non-ribosomal peptide synthetase [Hymenobacter sp. CRA2]OON70556.1 hypothetical protein B0919_00580 [Hymenobacter sp. CRA2]
MLEQVKASKQELLAFLRASAGQAAAAPISPVALQDHYPTSNAQNRLWVLSQFEGGATAYNIVTGLYLKGQVDRKRLERAFQLAIQRHESLRTVFQEVEGEPRQIIRPHMPFTIGYGEAPAGTEQQAVLQAELEQATSWAFDLENGPLLKVKLLRMADEAHAMLFGMHHIISDGWSVGVLIQEVMHSYVALGQGQEPLLSPLSIQYKDYVHWLDERMAGARGEQARTFWLAEQPQAVEPLELPADFARPPVRSFEGAMAKYYFSGELHDAIEKLCKQQQVTLFSFLRATLTLLLHKLSGQEAVVLGTPVSGRNHIELENQVGLYTNTVALKSHVNAQERFVDFLKQTSDHSLRAFEFQDYPLDKVIEDLGVKRDPSRNPLFDVMLVLQNTSMGDGAMDTQAQGGFALSFLDRYLREAGNEQAAGRAAKFDLTFNFSQDPDGAFFAEIEYATRLFSRERVGKFWRVYQFLLTQILANPAQTIAGLEIVDAEERRQLLEEFNVPVETVDTLSINELLREPFHRYAQRPALLHGEQVLTYAEVEAQVDAAARYLAQLTATSPAPFVGLLLGRSEWTVMSVLAILKAGAAYVPIDIRYPSARIEYILADARPAWLLVDDEGQALVPADYAGTVLHLNELKARAATANLAPLPTADLREQTAYLIYTSGSTGQPKAVNICHRNTIAFLDWCREEFAATPFDVLYAATSYCFDLSVFEFLYPLMAGKAIRVLASALEIPTYAGQDRNVLLNTVPAVVKGLLEERFSWANVTALNMAGEQVPYLLKQELDFARIEIRNLYGPSEDTTYSTVYRFAADGHAGVPIGKPVGYTQLYILDKQQRLVPVGVEGEIYLSGQSVAKGYVNKPELTQERFLPNPFVEGLTMYKTGDAGKWLPDGNVAFCGRLDDQVKVRGYRIEPGEIQYLLEQHPEVERAVVNVPSVAGEPCVVVYWKGTDAVSAAELKATLAAQLPSYMVPDYFVRLAEIPLNSNGKVDKRQLPLPEVQATGTQDAVPPTDFWQTKLWALWQEVLRTESFGVTDNFFELGGHSLKAARLRYLVLSQLQRNLSLNELFQYPTIAQQATLLEARGVATAAVIQPAAERPFYPISYAQERLWVLTKFAEASTAYHMPAAFRVKQALNVSLLEAAFRHVIARHEVLRTVFTEAAGQPVQRVLEPADLEFSIDEITLDQTLTPEEETAFLQQEWNKPFDLETGPLLRCFLLHMPGGSLLSVCMHHIISDGWSVGVLHADVMRAYQDLLHGQSGQLPTLGLQFKDYATWQREQQREDALQPSREFWATMFAGDIPVLELPTDFHRPEVKTYRGTTHLHQFDQAATARLTQLATSSGVSLFMALMAGVKVLLKKYSNQQDIVVGTPVAGRNHQQLQDQIGFYVNTLAVRTQIDSLASFQALLWQERDTLLQAFEHQAFPFETLVESLGLKRDLARSPLFDVMVVLQNLEGGLSETESGLPLQHLKLPSGTAKYDLTFTFAENQHGLLLELEYNTDLFAADTAARLGQHLAKVFEQVTQNPELPVKNITLLDEAAYEVLLSKADQTAAAYDETATLVSLFQQAAVRFPDRIALVVGARQLTYRELDLRSGQLARVLIQEHHVQPEDLVALHFGRSEWMLVAILAVLKAGAAYVPIDPTYPTARINYLLEDSGTRLLLYDAAPSAATREQWASVAFLNVAEVAYTGPGAQVSVEPEHLAYVIYTSGTTGNPKGVLIEHRNVTRLLFHEGNHFAFRETDNWSLFHSYCFDFSVWEMYGALLYGGTLVMVPKEVAQDSVAFYDFLLEEQITVLNQTPTAFRSLVQSNQERFADAPLAVRYLVFGGEALMPEVLRTWAAAMPQCRNINMYGITETTVHVTFKELTAAEIEANKSNIGLPIPTLSCYVLDADLQQVPVGVIGELCVGGAGVARGYLNKPALTAERFVADPVRKPGRLYRSGDYARILANGDLEYIGRKDDQVKIRGHRIETAEVEAAIMRQEGVKDAVVLPYKNKEGEYELSAYYITPESLTWQELRQALIKALPAYMVPSHLFALAAFPINSNGKLDKTALPQPTSGGTQSAFVDYRHALDRQIAAIWEEILEKENIGIRDNFFELGGHSLKATRVLSRIHAEYGVKVDLRNLFLDPTVEHLANYIETVRWMDNQEAILQEDQDELIF